MNLPDAIHLELRALVRRYGTVAQQDALDLALAALSEHQEKDKPKGVSRLAPPERVSEADPRDDQQAALMSTCRCGHSFGVHYETYRSECSKCDCPAYDHVVSAAVSDLRDEVLRRLADAHQTLVDRSSMADREIASAIRDAQTFIRTAPRAGTVPPKQGDEDIEHAKMFLLETLSTAMAFGAKQTIGVTEESILVTFDGNIQELILAVSHQPQALIDAYRCDDLASREDVRRLRRESDDFRSQLTASQARITALEQEGEARVLMANRVIDLLAKDKEEFRARLMALTEPGKATLDD